MAKAPEPIEVGNTETIRAMLEIGCDVGIAEAAQVFGGSPSEIARVLNPFRRVSTTITECTCAADSGTFDKRQAVTSPRCPVHGSKAEHGPTPEKMPVIFSGPKEPVCASTRGFECDCAGTICKAGSR